MSVSVSVIIPFYSNVIWLKQAVQSVLCQTYKSFEIILVNDGSKEDLKLFIEEYGSKVNYFKTVNRGPGHARNYGINKASGEYIAFLDSDDIWLPNKLESQIDFMESNDLEWTHSSYSIFNDKNYKTIKEVRVAGFEGDIFIKRHISSPIATPCVIIKSSVFIENKSFRFSENLRFGQDSYLWGMISDKYPLGALDEVLVKVRIRGSNAGRRARVQLQSRANTWTKILENRKKRDYRYLNFPAIPLFLFNLSFCFNSLIGFLEKKISLNPKISELLSKVLYAPIYVSFKIYNTTLK
ncbi:glycosyltransferase family 2 protein [Mesonia maritima]|uniref:Glycosyltransferase involved in cell wall biosynthesis n=1 Tax=Mesonia maritima TaxID=1793873 RepID=A0ABU1K880_9FLAO|nr:glycosyltransferase family 2 protein [Mesonia maritima]MDR6301796.1 glycosyltransferase involved in cell wall biosynthesis [Mesonia maritima]